MKSLRSINLNLLPVLREVLRKRSVTRAAEALGMSQPAVSEALGRLRKNLNDELLVLEGRAYVPTALGARLERKLETALAIIEEIAIPDSFDPAQATATVKIASNDYVVFVWGGLLAAHLFEQAPGLSVEFEEITVDTADMVLSGLVDFATVPSDVLNAVRDRYDTVELFGDDIVCLVPAVSAIERTISREQLSDMPHVTYLPVGRVQQSLFKDVLLREAIPYRPRVSVSAFSVLPHLVASTGAVALTFRRLAETLSASSPVRVVELPFDSTGVAVTAISRRDMRRDPLMEWLREQFAVVAALLAETNGDERG